jgi:putative hemolysin
MFDAVCDHLLIRFTPTGAVVGTYRMQTGLTAARNLGYYSEQEFEFAPYEGLRAEIMELGRACIHKDHRNLKALHLLWRGIAAYAKANRCRYLLGCSSLTSQDMKLGTMMYQRLAKEHLADESLQTVPLPALAMGLMDPLDAWQQECPPPPKLLRAYLGLGGKICGPPAIDREFKTIDFLTVLDLTKLPPMVSQHFFGSGGWR